VCSVHHDKTLRGDAGGQRCSGQPPPHSVALQHPAKPKKASQRGAREEKTLQHTPIAAGRAQTFELRRHAMRSAVAALSLADAPIEGCHWPSYAEFKRRPRGGGGLESPRRREERTKTRQTSKRFEIRAGFSPPSCRSLHSPLVVVRSCSTASRRVAGSGEQKRAARRQRPWEKIRVQQRLARSGRVC